MSAVCGIEVPPFALSQKRSSVLEKSLSYQTLVQNTTYTADIRYSLAHLPNGQPVGGVSLLLADPRIFGSDVDYVLKNCPCKVHITLEEP